MPGRATHVKVGTAAGVGMGLFHARDETGFAWLSEVAGAAWGGKVGGLAPDVLEPARSPCHRSSAHSVLALLGVSLASLEAARRYCRTQADACAVRRADQTLSTVQQAVALLLEFLWRFLAGALGGMQAGYVSHLVLDAATPMSLPLICR
ncbi:metal-dependent hydrolase [Longimicrobium sp.]|uniref:metal-dependent hydrolase n=1 Tax=Longimicrobium sp. TaxID=2029185 RepID=UPI003B3BC34B